mmetsp:Transcript_128293/g.256235  ORF Transcript_128293/g.256235 Transcript_128293/m.256235 type:complete len:829 (+) Transcript_128293:44-2530(+)
MSQAGFAPHTSDDQDRLLDEASAVVKEQAYYMKRAIDNDNVREALKHASNLICELRTSQLSPKNYYELYMQVFQETQHLAAFFSDKSRHGRKFLDLYESVQHAGNILPRLYLLVTVGASYIKSKEAPAKEILKDVNELCKGVQHPLRGLFLRYYLSQMLKDKLPDTGSGYEGEGGDINDAFDFVFTNFNESNRLWVRIQNQGPTKDKQKREKERHDLRVLVGANLVRLSQLEGMTTDFYNNLALPKILDHIVTVKDTMSQQYLFESMIQVFPDEFHIRTLELLLSAYTKALPNVDMKPIMVTLMERLARYLQEGDGAQAFAGMDIFSLFRSHLQQILERALEGGSTSGQATTAAADISAPLEVQAAFMEFTLSLYPDKLHYVDIILESTAQIVKKYMAATDITGSGNKLGGPGAEKVVDLLSHPLKTLSLSVLEMEHYPTLLGYLNFETRKQVAISLVNTVIEQNLPLTSVDAVNNLFNFITPLIKDEDDTPSNEGSGPGKAEFAQQQTEVCKLVHQIRVEDTDLAFRMISAMRGFFGQGGPVRLAYTLQPTFFAAMGLIPRIRERDERRADEEGDGPAPQVTVKKIFQFMHKTNTALVQSSPDASLILWLAAAAIADQCERGSGSQGSFEPICYEFLTQALIVFEDELSDSAKQFSGIFKLVGSLTQITCLEAENFDNIGTKITQHAARLLKKPLQCRAVAACSHLFWCDARRDGKRVLECLQKCLKIADNVVTSDSKQVGLWVEMLDKYSYYYEHECEDVTAKFVQSLINLCFEHIAFAENDVQSASEGRQAKAHLQASLAYLRGLKASSKPEVAAHFAELSLDAP